MSEKYVTDKQVLLEIRKILKQQLSDTESTEEFCSLLYFSNLVKEATGFDLRKD